VATTVERRRWIPSAGTRREYGGSPATIGGHLATKKQKARAAAAGKEPTGKPKPKKKTSRGK